MGYVDRFFYGQAKIFNATTNNITVDGKTVAPNASIMVAGTKAYTVNKNGTTETIYAGYGDYIRIGEE